MNQIIIMSNTCDHNNWCNRKNLNRTGIILLIIYMIQFAFTTIKAQNLKPERLGGKYGYVDKKGKTVIPYKYKTAWDFKEGLAPVEIENKWGFIDTTGKLIIPMKYEDAYCFFDGLAKVKLEGKWGYIDRKGKKIIPFDYEWAGNFKEGMSTVLLNNKYGIIDTSGKEITPFKYEKINSFSEGVSGVKLGGKWGLINKSGKEIIPCKYDNVLDFEEGIVKVEVNNKRGYIDISDKEVVAIKYDNLHSFSDGICLAKLNNKYGYINKEGKEVIPIKYDNLSYFFRGTADAELNGRKFSINRLGAESVDFTKIEKVFSSSEGMQLAMDKSTQKFGYLDEKGFIVLPFIYLNGGEFNNNRAKVVLNNKSIYIDKTGTEKIDAKKYLYAQTFYNGFAVVQNIEEKYAFIDTTGKLVTDFIYSMLDGFGKYHLAPVCIDGKCGFLGLDFKPAFPLIYKHVDYFSESGLAHVISMEGKHGYINHKGEFVIPAIYDEGSKDWNTLNNNTRSGWPYQTYMVVLGSVTKYIDATGKEVTPLKIQE